MERITVKRASELLGVSALTVRMGIENKDFDFGTAIHVSKVRTNYHISPSKLADYLGMTVDQVKGETH